MSLYLPFPVYFARLREFICDRRRLLPGAISLVRVFFIYFYKVYGALAQRLMIGRPEFKSERRTKILTKNH